MGIISNISTDAVTLLGNAQNLVTNAKSIVGGMIHTPPAASAQFDGAKDLRARLRVPDDYLSPWPGVPQASPMAPLFPLGGILFPFTPTISIDNKAEYATLP